jgi:hypothetical protein
MIPESRNLLFGRFLRSTGQACRPTLSAICHPERSVIFSLKISRQSKDLCTPLRYQSTSGNSHRDGDSKIPNAALSLYWNFLATA